MTNIKLAINKEVTRIYFKVQPILQKVKTEYNIYTPHKGIRDQEFENSGSDSKERSAYIKKAKLIKRTEVIGL